jgi:hypothetical protein
MPTSIRPTTARSSNPPTPPRSGRTPDHTATLAHAVEVSGTFSTTTADGYALLHYPPCWHLGEFRADRLIRFVRLNRTNLRRAFGQPRGDQLWHTLRPTPR